MIVKKVLIALAYLTRLDVIKAQDSFESQYDLSAFTGADGQQLGDASGLEQVQEVFTDVQQCVGGLLDKFEVQDEAMDLFKYIATPDWIETAEFGSKEQFHDKLGQAIDPLSMKILHAPGIEVVKTMPYEMAEWIRDTTSLWIKNKGAGSTTTEEEIQNGEKEDEMQKQKTYYQEQIDELVKEANKKDAKILSLYNAINSKTEDHDSLMELMSQTHEQEQEDLTERLEEKHDAAISKVKAQLSNEHDGQIDELTDELDKQCDANLKKFKRTITLEYQKGVKDLQKYLTKTCDASAAKLKEASREEIMLLQVELDELRIEYEELNVQHSGLQEDNSDLQDKHEQLDEGIKRLEKELAQRLKENEDLRNNNCIRPELEDEENESTDPLDFVPTLTEEEQEDEEDEEEEEETSESEGTEEENNEDATGEGIAKTWGSTRTRFNKGSQMRQNNKAFIKNQLEKEDYVNRDVDYYHGGEHYYSTEYNSYYTPVTHRLQGEDQSFSSFTCSLLDVDCEPCATYDDIKNAACEEHQFCFFKDGTSQCHTCAKYGKTCRKCSLAEGCTNCGEHHWAVGGICFKSLW